MVDPRPARRRGHMTPPASARYRAGAAAIAKVDSYMQPTGETLSFMRWGVTSEKQANTTAPRGRRRTRTSSTACSGRGRGDRVPAPAGGRRADERRRRRGRRRRRRLRRHGPRPRAPGGHRPRRDPTRGAPAIRATRGTQRRRAQAVPPHRSGLPHRAAPRTSTATAARGRILATRRARHRRGVGARRDRRVAAGAASTWHRRGGPAHERPTPLAFGDRRHQGSGRAAASGTCADGPGNVKLFDPTAEPRRTCLDLGFAAALFADCPDRELVSMLLHGVQMKTDAMAHQIVLMPNLCRSTPRTAASTPAAAQMADMREHGLPRRLHHAAVRALPRDAARRGPKKGTTELRGIGDQGQPRKRLLHAALAGGARGAAQRAEPRGRLEPPEHGQPGDGGPQQRGAAGAGGPQRRGSASTWPSTSRSSSTSSSTTRCMLWQMGAIVPAAAPAPERRARLRAGVRHDHGRHARAARWRSASRTRSPRPYIDACNAMERRAGATRALRARAHRRRARRPGATRAAAADVLRHAGGALQPPHLLRRRAPRLRRRRARGLRLLRVFHRVDRQARATPAALAREKQQTGVGVVWLGAHLSAALGLVWVPKDKAAKAAASLRTALRGELPVGDYRRLLGLPGEPPFHGGRQTSDCSTTSSGRSSRARSLTAGRQRS